MNKKKRNTILILIAIVLVFAVLIVVSANSNSGFNVIYRIVSTPFVKIQEGISSLGSKVSQKLSYLREHDEVKARLDELQKENDSMRSALTENENLTRENEELRKLLELKDYYQDYKLVAANIIAEDVTDWYNEFTVDVGTNDGVSRGDPVITGSGLVGIVSVAAPNSSKIMTIADEQNIIMGRISRSNELVRVRGISTENYTYEMKLDRVAAGADLYVGDVIVTAESGGVFPRGIRIGVVAEISTVTATETRTARVIPYVNLNNLSEVTIMTEIKDAQQSDSPSE